MSDIFGVDRRQLDELIATALRSGGNYADLYFEHSTFSDLMLRDGSVGSGGFHVDYGVGIRVLAGEKTGYAYSESTAMTDMLAAARAAGAIAAAGGKAPASISAAPIARNDFYPSQRRWREDTNETFLPVLKKLEKAIYDKAEHLKPEGITIAKIIAKLSSSDSDIMVYNSLGELTKDSRPLGSLVAAVIFVKGDQTEQKTSSRSFRMGPEMLSDALIDEMAGEACRGLEDRFAARRPKGGQMPVIMGAGASGILLHEAMGHAFEADFVRKGQSIFTGRIGEQICAKGINIVDDGTITSSRGALNIDDEGVPGQKTYMVRDGRLESFLHDRISAAHFGVPPTGNGRRESFRYNPIPRMRATYMESVLEGPAASTKEAMIASVRKGIYVDEFSNGQVKIGEGDFTFYVKSGYLVENGRLTMPVKDINIIGNGPRALSDITMAAADLRIDNGTWTCGKEQSAAVSCGIPTVLVKSLTVGGE